MTHGKAGNFTVIRCWPADGDHVKFFPPEGAASGVATLSIACKRRVPLLRNSGPPAVWGLWPFPRACSSFFAEGNESLDVVSA
jgi:hypothetical protein